ncbi:cytochrome P450 [Mycolicibacterium austroafricanum]|uniref:cytochrome P450 n=1 Tax=Mycolicibacterium austroafricanum TaxID=39687 RepID=UPI000A82FEF1|nr:cytochrome P450 [Mycolicibacterium austroafricanum]
MTSSLKDHVQEAAVALFDRFPARTRPLATPPPGSGLKAVIGDSGAPGVGYALNLTKDPVGFFRSRYEKYGEISWIGAFGRRCAVVFGPEGTERVIANRNKEFSAERGWGYFGNPFFAGGILFMDGEEHLHHRRVMQEAFTRSRLIGYMREMDPEISRTVKSWSPSETFRVYHHINQMTLDVATKVFVGAEGPTEADGLNKLFVECHGGVTSVVRADIPGGAWHRGLAARKQLEEYFYAKLPAKRRSASNDLFSVLSRAETEDGERFTDEDVVNQMIFFQLAAHETTTITTAMFAYFLAKFPQWQDRLRAEAQALGKEQLEFEDFEALPTFELAFKETLRMNSPVGLIAREATSDTEILGHFIPSGTLVLLPVFSTHRIEQWWTDPDTFDPERYTEERREDKRHRYIWAPFGGHAHKCIGMYFGGMEVKSAIYHMLLEYSWTVPDGYEPPIVHGTGPLPSDGLPIQLRRLHQGASQ